MRSFQGGPLFLNPLTKKKFIFYILLTVPNHHLEMEVVTFHVEETIRIK